MRRRGAAFTLIELLVVIAIIGLLATLLVAQLSNSRVQARNAQAKSDMAQMGLAVEAYKANNDSYFLAIGGEKLAGTADTDHLTELFDGGAAFYPIKISSTPGADYSYTYQTSSLQSIVCTNPPYHCQKVTDSQGDYLLSATQVPLNAGDPTVTYLSSTGSGSLALAAGQYLVPGSGSTPQVQGLTTFTATPLADSDQVINPMRGLYRWYNQEYAAQDEPALYEYARFSWNQVETSQGHYDFSVIDAAVNAAKAKGHKYAFRIMPVYAGQGNVLPGYLAPLLPGSATAYNTNGSVYAYSPDWNDPDYLSAANNLTAALAAHYDGNPAIAWIDIGMYGDWGEWHADLPASAPAADKPIPQGTVATKQALVKAYFDDFKSTRLLMPTDDADGLEYAMGLSPAIGLRRDSLCDPWFANGLTGNTAKYNSMKDRWKTAPFMTEKMGGTCDLTLALPQVEQYHVSGIGNGNFPASAPYSSLSAAQKQAFVDAGNAAGYRFSLVQASFPQVAVAGSGLEIDSQWANTGNAPAYDPWSITFQLRLGDGSVAWSGVSSLNLESLLPTSAPQAQADAFSLPSGLAAGTYSLVLQVLDPSGYWRPMGLAISGIQGDRSYLLGQVSVK